MPTVNVKTILLVNKRKARPETVKAIAEAEDGAVIAVEPDEFAAFQMLMLMRGGALRKALPDQARAAEKAPPPGPDVVLGKFDVEEGPEYGPGEEAPEELSEE